VSSSSKPAAWSRALSDSDPFIGVASRDQNGPSSLSASPTSFPISISTKSPTAAPTTAGQKLWSIDEAIRAVQDAKRKGQLPEFAKHKLQKGKISSKVANDKGQTWDLPDVKVITGEETEKDAGDEAGDEGANRVLNRTEDDVSMHTRLMAGGLRVVRQRKMDKDKVAAAIDRCRQPTDEEDDGPKETQARWAQRVQSVREWELPAPEVAFADGFVGFLHKVGFARAEARLLPAPRALTGRSFRSCAVVGPSGIAHKVGYAHEIDRADMVARINNHPTRRYQAAVGAKTHLRFLNEFWALQYADPRKMKFLELEKNVTLVLTARLEEAPNIRRVLSQMHRDDVGLVALNEKWFFAAHQLILSYKICLKNAGNYCQGGDMPTSSMLAIYSLMHVCHNVTIYGFSNEKTQRGQLFTYFKDDLPKSYTMVTAENRGSKHSYDAEYALFKAMAGEGHFTICGLKGCRNGSDVFLDSVASGN